MAVDKDYFDINKNNEPINAKDLLLDNESILLTLTPYKTDYFLESFFSGLLFVLLWAGFDTFFIIMMARSGFFETVPWSIAVVVIFFILHLIPVWNYFANIAKRLIQYKKIEYTFTDQRIIIRSGVVSVDFKTFFYSEINEVQIKVGLLDRLFKVGDIHITANTKSAVIEDIKNPYEYGNRIQKLIKDIKADISYPNDLRPEENHGYNTKYKAKKGQYED